MRGWVGVDEGVTTKIAELLCMQELGVIAFLNHPRTLFGLAFSDLHLAKSQLLML